MFRKGTESGTKDDLIWALKKKEELGLQEDYVEADAGFEVLALMHKSNSRFTLKHYKDGKEGVMDEIDEGEKHLAPQHRRFLTHPKVGPGAPQQREKMNTSMRLDNATAAAHKYQMVKLGYVDQDAGTNDLTKHKGIDSMIEDKIQLAILQGDFDNLPTAGKPTRVEYQNPLIDRTTDLAYEILRKNGIKPEWIELQQSMNQLKDDLRVRLRVEWSRHCVDYHIQRVQLNSATQSLDGDGSVPVPALVFQMPSSSSREEFVTRILASYDHDEKVCNSKVDAYNLKVPSHVLTRGRVMLPLEVDRIVREVVFHSQAEASAMHAESSAAARQMDAVRYAASLDMASRAGQDKSVATTTASKGPGHRYQRTVYSTNAVRSSQSAAGGVASGYGTAYYSSGGHGHGHCHGSGGGRSLLTNYTTSSGSSGRSGLGGDLVMRSLMMPVDLLATSLMRALDRLSF